MSKDAQLKILNILCINGASFYSELHSQYFLILFNLLEYYKDFPNNDKKIITLQNFTPEVIEIPNEDINLEPIYVKVKDISTCKTLINFILQLLSESIPLSLLQYKQNNLVEQAFTCIIDAIQNFSIDVKYMSLVFFCNLIKNMNKQSVTKFYETFPNFYILVLHCLEAIVQNMNILIDKCEIDSVLFYDFNKMLLEFLEIIENDSETESRQILIRICSVILSKTSSRIFNKELKLHCLLLSRKVELPKDLLNISDNMDSCEIEKLTDYYSKNILEDIQVSRNINKPIDTHDSWCYTQVLSVVNSLKTCEQSNMDIFLINHYLQRCHKALGILEFVAFELKKLFDDEKSYDLISMQNIRDVWITLIQLQKQHKFLVVNNENCFDSIIKIVLSTINLCKSFTKEDTSLLLRILCLHEIQSPEKNLPFSENIRLKILKSLLVAKIHIKSKTSEWDSMITSLHTSLVKNKESNNMKEVNMQSFV